MVIWMEQTYHQSNNNRTEKPGQVGGFAAKCAHRLSHTMQHKAGEPETHYQVHAHPLSRTM